MGPSVTDIRGAGYNSAHHSVGFSNAIAMSNSGVGQDRSYGSRDAGYNSNLPLRGGRSRSRSRSPTDRILDIQTDDNQYTEVFSWGADYHGQLGLGINLTGD